MRGSDRLVRDNRFSADLLHKSTVANPITLWVSQMQAEQIRASYAAMARTSGGGEARLVGDGPSSFPRDRQSPVETATRPVHVVLMTGHFFGKEYERIVPNMHFRGAGRCTASNHKDEGVAAQIAADALWYHVPHHVCGSDMTRNKRRKEQLSVGMSMEVGGVLLYGNSSQVLVPYFQMSYMKDWEEKLPLPTALKKNAIAYINSNCATPSGRDRIMDSLIRNGSIPVESYGACANNMGHSRDKSKLDIFREYKFCVCMENSLARGYVTEKVYDGLVAGCLPIYYGAPDIANFRAGHERNPRLPKFWHSGGAARRNCAAIQQRHRV
eukprot:jgi/Botrbrau1/14325/Bobra.0287s0017.1